MFISLWVLIPLIIIAIPVLVLAVMYCGYLIAMAKNNPFG
jgi:hypothetical protein